ncbi:MAG: NACHT domain-containing protein, partial [Desulfobacterales bacterium]|nr:NACHT domain-containing protein [Desulfobacterales bacterium]
TREFVHNLDGKKSLEKKTREERLASLDIKAAFEALNRHKIKDMVILGDPGSGKTTLLKYILLMLIDGKAEDKLGLSSNLIPFFAPLRELRDPDSEPFIDFIKRVCWLDKFSIPDETFKALLYSGGGVILLDGLDEVADEETRIKTCQWIDEARKTLVNTRFLLTSRFAGYMGKSRLSGNALELSIQDFTPEEVEAFLVRWFETVEVSLHPGQDEIQWQEKGREDARKLVERIHQSAHIQKLAVNPLLLQIIALVHRDRGTLPRRRVELYDECTNVLLEKWDMAKGLDVLLTAREARQILQPLALWLHEVDQRRSAPLETILEVVENPLEEMGKSTISSE